MIKKFTEFDINEANTQAKGLDIKNEYTKLINDPTLNTLDLGTTDNVSDTDITNIQQTYKDSLVKVVDGHYILIIKEGTIIRFSEYEYITENMFYDYFKKIISSSPKLTKPLVNEYIIREISEDMTTSKWLGSIAGYLEIDKFEFNQIVNAYKTKGFETLNDDWKEKFIKIVECAQFVIDNKDELEQGLLA